MTWIEKLRDALPNSWYVRDSDNAINNFCPYKFFGEDAPNYTDRIRCKRIKCEGCWNGEVTNDD